MSKMKKSLMVIIIGLLLMGTGFFVHLKHVYCLTIILIGFIVQIIGMIINRKKKIILFPILVLIFSSILILIDYLFVINFNRIPVFSLSTSISQNAKIYNGVLYRVWKCDTKSNKMFVDNLYKSNYYCDSSELHKIDINEFLLHFEEKFDVHKDKFVKIEGKISEIQGINYLEMKAYEEEVDSLNGYVVFDDNVKLRFIFNKGNEKLSEYSLYDGIKVIGRVSKMVKENNDQYTIIIRDSKIVNTARYNDFEAIVEEDDYCNEETKIYYENEEQKYYFNCLNKISIKYNEEDTYELDYLLKEKKLEMKDIYKKAISSDTYDDGGSILYHFDNFNILKCNTLEGNNDIIFGKKDLTKTENFCYTDITPEESDEVVD